MPVGNRKRRSHKRSIHRVYVQCRHSTRNPHGNTHPTTSVTIRTQLWTRPRKSKSNQHTTQSPPTPLPHQISSIQRNQASSQNPRQGTHNRNPQQRHNVTPSNPCRRFGVQFTQEHLQVCPAKKVQCNLWMKVGHYCKVCRSAKLLWQSQQIIPQQTTHKPEG